MFYLVALIIAIILGAVLMQSGLFNGGETYLKSSTKGYALQLANAGQQIMTANTVYSVENGGQFAPTLSDLTADKEYLSSLPSIPDGFSYDTDVSDNQIKIVGDSPFSELCMQINKQAGYGDEVVLADAAAATGIFGCYQEGGNAVFITGGTASTP